jgi:hypothetical protein
MVITAEAAAEGRPLGLSSLEIITNYLLVSVASHGTDNQLASAGIDDGPFVLVPAPGAIVIKLNKVTLAVSRDTEKDNK